jgi:FixJ family two-component response regulator
MAEGESVVFVVDDDSAVRCSLQRLVKSVGLNVKTYEVAQQFLDEFDPGTPGCLVLDVRLNGMSGLDVQRELARRGAGTPIIMISGHGDIPTAVEAVRAGAIDFLEKPFSHEALLGRIWEALALDVDARRRRLEQEELRKRLRQLTSRQRQVLERIANGQTTAQVANELGLSLKTVYAHRSEALAKMNSGSVTDAARQLMIAKSA